MKRLWLIVAALLAVSLVCAGAAPRTLRIEIFDRGNVAAGVITDGPPAKWIQQAFGDPNNIKIEWVPVPRAQEVAQLNVMMAAGNAPDLSFTYDAVLVGSYVSQGGLADLTTYVNQAATLKAWTGMDALAYGTWGGKIYAIPGKRQVLGISGSWIRKDWLDKLGLPIPKTTQEWLTAVRAFRDKDPGKLGANLVPIGGGFPGGPDINIMYSFYKPATQRDMAAWIGPTSTRPARDLAIPGAKDGLRFCNMLQNEGLIQKDWALWPKNDTLNFNGALSNGYVGAFENNAAYLHIYNIIPTLKKNAPDAVYVPIDPFTNSQGQNPKYIYNPIGIFNIVPVFSKNADLVVKYLDWMAQVPNMVKIIYGNQGEHYDVNPDGIVVPRQLTGSAVWEAGNIMDRVIILNGRPYNSLETVIKAQVLGWLPMDDRYTMSTFLTHYTQLSKDGIAPVRIANPPDSLSKMGPMLLDKAEEFIKRLIMAKPAEFDALYDSLLNEWLDLGARQVKADMLKQYDAEHPK
jgi:putative aldouronate transport system substrate-binding protein